MTGEGRRQSSREELALAREDLAAARDLLALAYPRVTLTRLYFAAFHAVRALLYSEDFEPRTHRGVQHLFNLHFIRPGRFEAPAGRLLVRLQKYREEADYGAGFPVDEDSAAEELAQVAHLVAEVEATLGERKAEREAGGEHRRPCPACRSFVFKRWPFGWDAHAAHRCEGLAATDPEERKREFKRLFGHLLGR